MIAAVALVAATLVLAAASGWHTHTRPRLALRLAIAARVVGIAAIVVALLAMTAGDLR